MQRLPNTTRGLSAVDGIGIVVILVAAIGCGTTAIAPGTAMPRLDVQGWTNLSNGDVPELDGKVVVLDVFATW